MSNQSPIDTVMDFLFRPVPLVPRDSFLGRFSFIHREKQSMEARRRRAAESRAAKAAERKSGPGRQFNLVGPLHRGRETQFAICNTDFSITPDTWVFGDLKLGAPAAVDLMYSGGRAYAKKVTIG